MRAATILTQIANGDGRDHPYSITPIPPHGDLAAYRVIRGDATTAGDYRTSLDKKGRWRCACADNLYRKHDCKHINEINRLFPEVEKMAKTAAELKLPDNGTATPGVDIAIHNVMRALGAVGVSKNRDNKAQGFKFRGIDDVLNVLSGALVDAGLVIKPLVVSSSKVERQSKSGGAVFAVTLRVRYKFTCIKDGSEDFAEVEGEAMDIGDKATNKAMSAAYKYMAIQTFCIPTEGEADADSVTHEVAPATAGVPDPKRPTEDMVERFGQLVKTLKLDPAKVADTLERNHKTRQFRELSWADAHSAIDWLERKVNAVREPVA